MQRRFVVVATSVVLVVASAPAAAAGAPSVSVSSLRSTSATSFAVTGTVNPGGSPASVAAEFAQAGTQFCDTAGAAGSPAGTGPPVQAGSGSANVPVTAAITSGLIGGQTYCVRLVVSAGATAVSGMLDATAGQPESLTGSFSGNGPTSAHIRGSVWTAGQATTVHFEYGDAGDPAPDSFCNSGGTTGAFSSTPDQAVAAAQVDVAVSATIAGLTIGADYCFRLVAQNGTGTAKDLTQVFVAGSPAVATAAATGVSATGATFHASVNPAGLSTSSTLEWAGDASPWCSSAGASGLPDGQLLQNAGSDSVDHDVAFIEAALAPSTTYCFRASATNARGTTTGEFLRLTTPAAPAAGGALVGTGNTTGTGNAVGAAPPPVTIGPFDALGLPKIEYDAEFKRVTFSVISGARGRLVARLFFRQGARRLLVGRLARTLTGKPAAFRLGFNAVGRRLFRVTTRARFTLVVTITPAGRTPITRRGSFTLRRAKDPCAVKQSSVTAPQAGIAC